MNSPSYREALSQSFKLIWNNKSLWIFGILSALFVSPFGMGGFWGQMILVSKETMDISHFPWFGLLKLLSVSDPGNFVAIVWFIQIILAVLAIVIFISVCAQTSLIINVCEYYKKKKHSNLSDTWHKSYKYFWRVLGYDIIRKLTLLSLLVFTTGLWFIVPENNFWNSLFLILSFIIVIFLGLVISAITVFASGYVVVENKKFFTGLKDGIVLFKNHFLVSFEISLVMLFLDLILASFISMIILLSFIPATVLWFIAGLFNSIILLNLSVVLSILIITFLIILIGGFYNAFNTGTWMYLFMRMHHEGIFPRIGHFFIKFFQK